MKCKLISHYYTNNYSVLPLFLPWDIFLGFVVFLEVDARARLHPQYLQWCFIPYYHRVEKELSCAEEMYS